MRGPYLLAEWQQNSSMLRMHIWQCLLRADSEGWLQHMHRDSLMGLHGPFPLPQSAAAYRPPLLSPGMTCELWLAATLKQP